MPGFNGMGPRGKGPMTGKGMGYCVVKLDEQPIEKLPATEGVFRGRGAGFGAARGCGLGRGRRMRGAFFQGVQGGIENK